MNTVCAGCAKCLTELAGRRATGERGCDSLEREREIERERKREREREITSFL